MPRWVLVCLAAGALSPLAAQEKDPWDADPYQARATAQYSLDLEGNASLVVRFHRVPRAPVFGKTLLAATRCDPASVSESPGIGGWTWSASCYRLLTGYDTQVRGRLFVSPLASALREVGIEDITLYVSTPLAGPLPADEESTQWHLVQPDGRGMLYGYRFLYWVPPPPALDLEYPRDVSRLQRLAAAILGVLFVPTFLALALRSSALARLRGDPAGDLGAAPLWLHSILTLMWLAWFALCRREDLLGELLLWSGQHHLAGAALTATVFALPPLLAVANCTAIWHNVAESAGATRQSFASALRVAVLGEARAVVPLAMLIAAAGVIRLFLLPGVALAAGAGVVFLLFSWLHSRKALPMRDLTGDLAGRVRDLAARAGVRLRVIGLVAASEHAGPNAFAFPGGIAISEELVEKLTPRETDAVIAHELGHIKSRHLLLRGIVFVFVVLFWAPFWSRVQNNMGASIEMAAWIPLGSIMALLAISAFSRRFEFAADAASARLTGDPEAMASALVKIARLHRAPIDFSSLAGAMLSHPSPRRRIEALSQLRAAPDAEPRTELS